VLSRRANSAGVYGADTKPALAKASMRSGCLSALAMASAARFTMALGSSRAHEETEPLVQIFTREI
jgi:hypothetical protein